VTTSPPETHGKTRRNRLILIALWFFFYSSLALFTPPLLDDADSVHAEVAREMLLRHDWVTLYANGIRYLEKAPLLYWSIATSCHLSSAHADPTRRPTAHITSPHAP
jgi:4-amino-4-deoxy-L-arabinose transferase-like glycosyltransferase